MKAIIWSKYHCPFCDQAKALMDMKGIEFEERKIGDGWTKEELLEEIPTARTVPQIILDGKLIGGFTELKKLLAEWTMDDDKLESSNTESDSEAPSGYYSNPHNYNFPVFETVDINSILGNLSTASLTFSTTPGLTLPNSNNYYASNVQYGFQSPAQLHPSLQVTGKVKIDGENADIIINGRSLTDFMSKLESRLAILQPNPEKLEQFEALKKAYDQYKLLESLCEIQKKEEE